MKWWEEFKTRHRKHKFDFINPTTVFISPTCILPQFRCKACGKVLMLNLWEMKYIPSDMAKGCPGKLG